MGLRPLAHASVFVASVSVSANSPALVLWRFVCVCVWVRVCVSAPPTRLYSLTPTPPTLWIMRSNHARHQPYTLYVPTSLPLSLPLSLSQLQYLVYIIIIGFEFDWSFDFKWGWVYYLVIAFTFQLQFSRHSKNKNVI